MTTMKSYTDLQQSRKLAEFLPHESADQTWERIAIAGANLDVPQELQYRHNGNMPFKCYSGIGLPCWSLAALLSVIKPVNGNTYTLTGTLDGGATIEFDEVTNVMYQREEIIDVVYDMVIKFREQKLL